MTLHSGLSISVSCPCGSQWRPIVWNIRLKIYTVLHFIWKQLQPMSDCPSVSNEPGCMSKSPRRSLSRSRHSPRKQLSLNKNTTQTIMNRKCAFERERHESRLWASHRPDPYRRLCGICIKPPPRTLTNIQPPYDVDILNSPTSVCNMEFVAPNTPIFTHFNTFSYQYWAPPLLALLEPLYADEADVQ